MDKFFSPFNVGTTVEFRRQQLRGVAFENGKTTDIMSNEKIGELHVICEVHIEGLNDYEYSTDHGAWFDHKCFEFVSAPDRNSMRKVIKQQGEF